MFENIWRKKEKDVIGKKLLDVFPELNDQKYPQLLNEVYTTGKVHSEIESVAWVQGDDGLKKFYLDFEYNPLFEANGNVSGIMITVNDVTEKVGSQEGSGGK
jgi:PAS domain S-box-containing protein